MNLYKEHIIYLYFTNFTTSVYQELPGRMIIEADCHWYAKKQEHDPNLLEDPGIPRPILLLIEENVNYYNPDWAPCGICNKTLPGWEGP